MQKHKGKKKKREGEIQFSKANTAVGLTCSIYFSFYEHVGIEDQKEAIYSAESAQDSKISFSSEWVPHISQYPGNIITE